MLGERINLTLDGVACDGPLGPSRGNHRANAVVRRGCFDVKRKMVGAGMYACVHDRVKVCFLGDANHSQ